MRKCKEIMNKSIQKEKQNIYERKWHCRRIGKRTK